MNEERFLKEMGALRRQKVNVSDTKWLAHFHQLKVQTLNQSPPALKARSSPSRGVQNRVIYVSDSKNKTSQLVGLSIAGILLLFVMGVIAYALHQPSASFTTQNHYVTIKPTEYVQAPLPAPVLNETRIVQVVTLGSTEKCNNVAWTDQNGLRHTSRECVS